jgi:hypothetical protein
MNIKTKNILIRFCYIIPFLFFLYTIIEDLFILDKQFRQIESMVVVATLIFLFQSIRNSIIGWILTMLLYLAFLYFVVIGIYTSIQNWGGKIDESTFMIQCLFALIYIGLGFLYWKIRPKKRIIK